MKNQRRGSCCMVLLHGFAWHGQEVKGTNWRAPKGAPGFFAWHPEGSNTDATVPCLTCGKQWEPPRQEGPVGLAEINISVGEAQ